MGAIKTGSSKVLTEGKQTARVGDAVLVTAAEIAAAVGSKTKAPSRPKNTGVATDTGLPPSAGGVGGSYEPALDYDGNLQPGVPGSVLIELDRTENSTYGTLQDHVNLFTSPGLITGGMFSSQGNTLTVAEGSVLLRVDDDDLSAVRFFDFAETQFTVPADNDVKYIGVVLQDGAAVVELRETFDFDKDTEIPLGTAFNINGSLFFLYNPYKTSDAMTNVIQRFDAISPSMRDNSIGGLIIAEGPGRTITLSAGKIWTRLTDHDIPDKDSSIDGMLTAYWNGSRLEFGSTNTWDNMHYCDVDLGQLVVLDDNRYACLWFYCAPQSGIYGYAYGRFQHPNVSDAALEQPPTYLTGGFDSQSILLGRLIFKKGAASASSVDSVFNLQLPAFALEENAAIQSYYSSTGVVSGGALSVNASNNQTFDVTGGTAVFMDFSDPTAPSQTVIEFGPFTGVVIPDLSTRLTTYIGIDNSGQIVQQGSPFTNEQRRSIASLGLVVHSNLTNINTTNMIGTTVHSPVNQLHDLMTAIGALNIYGNVYNANGANLLINKTSGRLFKIGANYANNILDPHSVDLGPQSGLTFRYRTRTGVESADRTTIDPNNYDVGGVVTDISPANRFTIQRIAIFQSGLTRIQYGQHLYGTMAEAEAALASEEFQLEQNIAENGIIRCYLIVQDGTTNLSDPTKAKFVQATKFGATAAGGVSISTTDQLPEGGTNLYFTAQRARDAVVAAPLTGNVTVTSKVFASGIELGFRPVPITDQNSNYVFVADDTNKARRKTDTGTYTYTVNAGVHANGDVLCAINFGSSANLTLAGNGVTLQLGGTLVTGNRTVNPGGVAYIYMQSSTHALVSGPGVS